MAAMPPSQAGRRASRARSRASKPAVWSSLAPLRWHSEAAAVHTLAATASRIALSISLPLHLASPRRVTAVTDAPVARPGGIGRVLLMTIPGPRRHRPDGVSLPGHAQGPPARRAAGDRLAPGSVFVLLRWRLPRPGPQEPGERAGDGAVAAFSRDQQQPR